MIAVHSMQASDIYAQLLAGDMRNASVGIYVMDINSGQVIAHYGEQRSLIPASVAKIVTTATAMKLYNDTARWYTDVTYTGHIDAGALYGDIYVHGCIDPTLANGIATRPTSAFVETLVAAIKQSGITAIYGNIVLDASLCHPAGISQWLEEDTGWYYGAGCYGINYKGNKYDLFLKTDSIGTTPVIIDSTISVSDIKYHNYLVAGQKDSSFVSINPLSSDCVLSGIVPAHQNRFRLRCSIPNPPLTLGNDIKTALQQAGINVEGAIEVQIVPSDQEQSHTLLCRYASDTLYDMLRETMHRSDNLYAEALLRYIALSSETYASASAGLAIERDLWQQAGLDVKTMQLYDGCGLARKNTMTPAFIASFLSAAYKDPQLSTAYVNLFPLAGSEGTLRSFMSKKTLSGELRLKSGSMSGVMCYAGYYKTSQAVYAVVLMCNNHNCRNSIVRSRYEKLLRQIFI